MIKALLVDDEEKSRKNLARLLELYCKDVCVTSEASSVEMAVDWLRVNNPDVVFLDIEMGDGSGFQLLRHNQNHPFQVILVTAHSHYAVKAFRYSAIDYLLKPVDVDDLVAAVEKLKHVYESPRINKPSDHEHYLEIRLLNSVLYAPFHDVIRLEADGSYTIVYLSGNEKHYLSYHLGFFKPILDNPSFFRVHKSHLVNLHHVKKVVRNDGYHVEMSDGSKVEIARRQKNDFLRLLREVKL